MNTLRSEWVLLLIGDLAALILSLYITLLVRYQTFPAEALLTQHYIPFSLLFIVSIILFFIAGLYDRQTLFTRSELPSTIFATQTINVIVAALFFFFVPLFAIAPKTNLLLFLFFSTVSIVLWRIFIFPRIWARGKCETALIISSAPEVSELVAEVNGNDRYSFTCLSPVSLKGENRETLSSEEIVREVTQRLAEDAPTVIIADSGDDALRPLLPYLFRYVFANPRTTFVNFNELYESLFERVALSSLNPEWFLEHATRPPQVAYDIVKRGIDIIGGVCIGFVLVLVTPLIWIAMRIEGEGSFYITQDRLGRYNKPIRIFKIRTMTNNERKGAWIGETENKVTRLGHVLRRTSIDELPQIFSVLKGDLSLIGPRSDIVALGERLASEVPYYTVRYTVTPGITGWAQTHQRYAPGQINPQSIEDSKVRLQYDLYYIKHRSLLLDISIALRTIKTLLVRLIP